MGTPRLWAVSTRVVVLSTSKRLYPSPTVKPQGNEKPLPNISTAVSSSRKLVSFSPASHSCTSKTLWRLLPLAPTLDPCQSTERGDRGNVAICSFHAGACGPLHHNFKMEDVLNAETKKQQKTQRKGSKAAKGICRVTSLVYCYSRLLVQCPGCWAITLL